MEFLKEILNESKELAQKLNEGINIGVRYSMIIPTINYSYSILLNNRLVKNILESSFGISIVLTRIFKRRNIILEPKIFSNRTCLENEEFRIFLPDAKHRELRPVILSLGIPRSFETYMNNDYLEIVNKFIMLKEKFEKVMYYIESKIS